MYRHLVATRSASRWRGVRCRNWSGTSRMGEHTGRTMPLRGRLKSGSEASRSPRSGVIDLHQSVDDCLCAVGFGGGAVRLDLGMAARGHAQ